MTDSVAPSQRLQAALNAFREAERRLEEAREARDAAIAADLTDNPGLSNTVVAAQAGLTQESVRVIARKYGVPHRRPAARRRVSGGVDAD